MSKESFKDAQCLGTRLRRRTREIPEPNFFAVPVALEVGKSQHLFYPSPLRRELLHFCPRYSITLDIIPFKNIVQVRKKNLSFLGLDGTGVSSITQQSWVPKFTWWEGRGHTRDVLILSQSGFCPQIFVIEPRELRSSTEIPSDFTS